jgi:hypothetical protein
MSRKNETIRPDTGDRRGLGTLALIGIPVWSSVILSTAAGVGAPHLRGGAVTVGGARAAGGGGGTEAAPPGAARRAAPAPRG